MRLMAQKLRKILPFMMALCLPFMLMSPAHSKSNPKYGSIVMEAETGRIILQDRANKNLHPASTTKMMTLSVLFDEIDAGNIKLYHKIRISKRAASMVPSKLGLKPGSRITVRNAILSLVTKSANDIAVAIAEHVSGSEWKFSKRMTAKAHQIGMSRTNFVNASGLHHKRQISTPRDMAILARYMFHSQQKYYPYFSKTSFTYHGKRYKNHNNLLRSYRGMDGFKTGYVRASGFNLVASAKQGDRRLIAVVFGGRTAKRRDRHMASLLNQGFKKIKNIHLASHIPVPNRRPSNDNAAPQEIVLAADYTAMAPASGHVSEEELKKILENSNYIDILGQGDIDPEMIEKIKSGITSASQHKAVQRVKPAVMMRGTWSIQVGAYFKKSQSNDAIKAAIKKLPAKYAHGRPFVSPTKASKKRLIYRARISGLTKQEAFKACKYIKDCIPVSPRAK